MGGTKNERQEVFFIDCIKDAVVRSTRGKITLNISSTLIHNVFEIEKTVGGHILGREPYADVHLYSDRSILRLSLKGSTAPSLAGGGMQGVELVAPGLGARFMKTVYGHLINKIRPGDKVPEMYGVLPEKEKILLVMGNELIGGPIDYIYIGPMKFTGSWHPEIDELRFAGVLHNSLDFAMNHMLYFRLRSRRWDQKFDPTSFDSAGIPKIYGASPSRGDSSGRLVITNKLPQSVEALEII